MRLIFGTALALFAVQAFAANGIMKGDGSAEKPFQIEDYEDLKAIGKNAYLYSSNYIVTKDIDASASKKEMCNQDGCNGFISIGLNADAAGNSEFTGSIDGKEHNIRDLRIWLPCVHKIGFISVLKGTVSNLNFDGLSVLGGADDDHDPTSYYVGGLAGQASHSTIANVHITRAQVQGQSYVGGLVGEIDDGDHTDIRHSSYQGAIKGKRKVGGLVGYSSALISQSFADVEIYAYTESLDRSRYGEKIGGLVGESRGTLQECHATGIIVPMECLSISQVGGLVGYNSSAIWRSYASVDIGESPNGNCAFSDEIGGLVGINKSHIEESFATGSVAGKTDLGGLVGRNNGGGIINSYAIGMVKSRLASDVDYFDIGGLLGSGGNVFTSYAVGKIEVNSNGSLKRVGGLVGDGDADSASYWNIDLSGLESCAGGVGLSDSAMMKFASFVGWDTLVWGIDEGKSYPYLKHVAGNFGTGVIAIPTSADCWTEKPVVAAKNDVGHELVGTWLRWNRLNDKKDSIYYGYRIGYVDGSDTVWGTTSYMAVPNIIKIASLDDLKKIGNEASHPLWANYELADDIDASASDFVPIGSETAVFLGTFDGKNHTIKNLTIESSYGSVGLFGYVQGATIKNLRFENAKVSGAWNVGVLAGKMYGSVVTNVVSLNGDAHGIRNVGGLIGLSYEDSLDVIAATGNVKGDKNVGGVVGNFHYSVLHDAFSINIVKGREVVGGLLGFVALRYYVEDPAIHRSYSASIVKTPEDNSGEYEGYGFANMWTGAADSTNCFFDSTVVGHVDADGGANMNGLSTAEMLKQATFKDYDFETVWEIQEGKSYPYFKGMDPMLPSMIKDDGSINAMQGEGTEESPYLISRYKDLKYIGKYEYKTDLYYKLADHIYVWDVEREECNSDGTECKGFEPIPEFSGVFIGNNKTIIGLYINRPDEDSVGLFRSLSPTAKVTGLMLDSLVIKGKNYVGGLAGVDKGAVLDEIYVDSDVSAQNNVGAIVGQKNGGSIMRSVSQGSVLGTENVGGIAGSLNKVTVADCFSNATISGVKNVGGFVGVTASAAVKNVYAAGNVKAISKFGGVAGDVVTSTYTSAYYDSLFWAVNVTAAGELRTTQQMVKKETFKGWDFDTIWQIDEGRSYPYLAWLAWRDIKVYPDLFRDATMFHMAGSGTDKDPFLIKTYSDLKSIGYGKYKLSAVYRLANDIDASESQVANAQYEIGFKPIGKVRTINGRYVTDGIEWDTSRVFSGKIHGGGHSIKNLYIKYYNGFYNSFIDSLSTSGVVDSLSFVDYSIDTGRNGGVTIANHGTIKNVSIKGSLKSDHLSAGFALLNDGTIENCSFEGKIEGDGNNSGFVNENKGKILNVKATVEISGYGSAGVAFDNAGSIKNAVVNAKINARDDYVGGIAAKNSGTVAACSAAVNIVSTQSYVGGLVGLDEGNTDRSIVTGSVEGLYYVGGLIGKVGIEREFVGYHSSVNVTGQDYVGGLFGDFSNSDWDKSKLRIFKSYSTGNVKGKDYDSAGGLVGRTNARIDSCYATGSVENGSGLVGEINADITNSYTTGKVVNGAGLVGSSWGDITNCYTMGAIENGAGFVYSNRDGSISNCYTTSSVNGGAGFVYYNGSYGSISNSYTTGSVNGGTGFANTNNGKIKECYATGDIENGAGFIESNYGSIEMCYATGSIYVKEGRGAGFALDNEGTIKKSFAIGNVHALDSAEGFIGYNGYAGFVVSNGEKGIIEQCYSIGNVEGLFRSAGGFAVTNKGSIVNSYSTGDLKFTMKNKVGSLMKAKIGVFVGSNQGNLKFDFATGRFEHVDGKRYSITSSNEGQVINFYYDKDSCSYYNDRKIGLGYSNEELHKKSSFKEYDFDSIWDIKEGITYPMLRGLPNLPYAGKADLKYDADKFKVSAVRADLQKKAIVFDPSYTLVVKFDSTSEKRLDSLEKAGAFASGNFDIDYRVGIVVVGDTIWSDAAQTKLTLNGSVKLIAQKSRGRFNVAFNGNLVSLRYELPKSGNVKFSLVDMQGRVVRAFDLGRRAAGGNFETLDVAEIARGRYIGILQVGGKAVEKTVLLKK